MWNKCLRDNDPKKRAKYKTSFRERRVVLKMDQRPLLGAKNLNLLIWLVAMFFNQSNPNDGGLQISFNTLFLSSLVATGIGQVVSEKAISQSVNGNFVPLLPPCVPPYQHQIIIVCKVINPVTFQSIQHCCFRGEDF